MIVCQNCRTQNADDAARCVSCGEAPTLAPKTLHPSDPAATATGFTFPGAGVPAAAAPAGTRIADRYELQALLGRGGMGLVYRARDLVLNEDTAIKLLQPHLMREVGDLERLKREITTARKITHPNVIRIHDFGLAGEEGFISMEILAGGTLHERLARGLVPVPEAVEIALGIADGLGAAHAQGVIHRDIKPHNVLFDAAGTPKLADFGLARLASATSQTMGFSGTPQYMSPELADGREITPRSDVYSTGVLFYELLAGKPPFQADSLLRLANLHSKEPPPALRSKRPDVPPALEAIVMRALEKDPLRRFADGRELASALRDYRAGATVRLPPPRSRGLRMTVFVGIGALALAAAVAVTTDGRSARRRKRDRPDSVAAASVVPTVTVVPVLPATPEPAPPVATVTPAATSRPKKTPSPRPARTAGAAVTPAPTAVAVAPAPTPTSAPVGARTRVSVLSNPWGEVRIDGVLVKEETPARFIDVKPGKRTVLVTHTPNGSSCKKVVDVPAGVHRKIHFDIGACTVTTTDEPAD